MSRFGVGRVLVLAAAVLVVSGGALAAQEVIDLPAADRRLNANFDEVFRVGSMNGELWETFGEVSSTGFDAEGYLYIFDRQATRIVKVDRDGNHVSDIGRAGEGPGEMRMAFGFTVMRDGTVVVGDLGHRAFTLYGSDGEYLRSVSMGAPGSMNIQMGPYLPDPDGDAVYIGGAGSIQMRMGGPGMAEPTTRPIERLALTGETTISEVVAEGWLPPPLEATEGRTLGSGGGGNFQISMPPPRAFEPELLVSVVEGGVAYVDSSAYEVNVTDASGSRVLRRSIVPEAVTPSVEDAERERRVAEIEEESSGGGGRVMMIGGGGGGGSSNMSIAPDDMRNMRLESLENLVFFPEVPVIRALASSWGGTLWVQRRGDEPVSNGAIDIVSPDGGYVGTFAAGETSIPSSFGPDGLAAFIEMDEYDVSTIVVRRLPGAIN